MLVGADIGLTGQVIRWQRTNPGFSFAGSVLPSGATLTRAGPAMRYNANGVLESIAADGARFDFDPVTLALRGLLTEQQRTNLLLQSQNLATYWGATNATLSAMQMVETAATGLHRASQNIGYVPGIAYTHSVTAAPTGAGSKRNLAIRLGALGFGVTANALFDLELGTCQTDTSLATASMAKVSASAWRCSVTMTATSSTVATFSLCTALPADFNISYAGDGVSGLNLTDGQIEAGGSASSVIPTTTAVATRSADALTLDWGSKGIGDGSHMMRYSFDDGASQDVATTVAGGFATVPIPLNRPWLRSVEGV